MARLLLIALLLLSLAAPGKAVMFAHDTIYFLEGGKSLKGVEIKVEHKGRAGHTTKEGYYSYQQRPNVVVELTLTKGNDSFTITVPAPTDSKTRHSPPPGVTGGQIGKGRTFNVDFKTKTITQQLEVRYDSSADLPGRKPGEERLPYLVHLLGGIMVLTLLVVIFGFGDSAAPAPKPDDEEAPAETAAETDSDDTDEKNE